MTTAPEQAKVELDPAFYITALEAELAAVNRERLMLRAAIDQQAAQLTAARAMVTAAEGAEQPDRDATVEAAAHSAT